MLNCVAVCEKLFHRRISGKVRAVDVVDVAVAVARREARGG